MMNRSARALPRGPARAGRQPTDIGMWKPAIEWDRLLAPPIARELRLVRITAGLHRARHRLWRRMDGYAVGERHRPNYRQRRSPPSPAVSFRFAPASQECR